MVRACLHPDLGQQSSVNEHEIVAGREEGLHCARRVAAERVMRLRVLCHGGVRVSLEPCSTGALSDFMPLCQRLSLRF
jgi:hypothetical protein